MNHAEPASQETMMTAEEVAQFLRISLSMVYKLRKEGTLPGIAVGALWRFHPEQVRAFSRGGLGSSASDSPVVPLSGRRRRV
jgi:excisionase family DNA binding protein